MWRFLLAVAMLCLFVSSPARADWLKAESRNFIVYSEGSEARLRERITLLEDYDRLLRAITNVHADPAPTKLPVYIVRGLRELRTARPGLTSIVAGFYTASPTGIAAFVDEGSYGDDNEILFHEYAHHFMMQYAAAAYPPWYVEGFAEYLATAEIDDETIEYGNYSHDRALWIADRQWIPMERVLFREERPRSDEEVARFYAQSWLLVHYLFSTDERRAALTRYLSALASGADSRTALQSELGHTPETLGRALRDYVRGGRIGYKRLRRGSRDDPPTIRLTRLPAAAEDLILYEAALRIGVADENAADYIEQIRRKAADHAGDPYAQRVLAFAEIEIGDPAAADPLLDRLIASTPDDAELMYLKGMRHLAASAKAEGSEAELREARRWFARAYQANPNHFQTLYHYAQSMSGTPQFLSENTSNILLLAHSLAPQVAPITLASAQMLIRRGQTDQAEALLMPLSADVHDSEAAAAARRMLQAAHERGGEASAKSAPPAAERDRN